MSATYSKRLQLQRDVQDALKTVKTILSTTRNPCLASPDTPHTYNDKFALSEFLTATSIASLCNALKSLGLDDNEEETTFQRLLRAVTQKEKSLTLRFKAEQQCQFLREEERVEESPIHAEQEEVVTSGKKVFKKKVKSTKMVTKVNEYHWKYTVSYSLYIFAGNDTECKSKEDSVMLQTRTTSCEFVTRGINSKENPPLPTIQDTIDASVTYLLQHVDPKTVAAEFGIDRSSNSCRTPTHNRETREMMRQMKELVDWCDGVQLYFQTVQYKFERLSNLKEASSLQNVKSGGIFVPVLPIFEALEGEKLKKLEDGEKKDKDKDEKEEEKTDIVRSSPLIPTSDVKSFLSEQLRTISEQTEAMSKRFKPKSSPSSKLMTHSEATIVLICHHMSSIVRMWWGSVDHIEEMLRLQLFNAIGKAVQSKDLEEFVRFNNQRLFSDTYAPEPFCYAIRRPGHYPDGMISIEENVKGNGEDTKVEHAMTLTRKLETSSGERPVFIPINAVTSLEFRGDMYLHAWVKQKFGEGSQFTLAARARQFSSFLLLLGKVSGPDSFEPEHAIILQNKDEVLIPILTEEMPSSKEFKDAIASLSPEQQRFAKAFRNMKLASSVFGVCIIQLKPQLEALLGLPEKSLTKEIQLTQDLLNLFIEYQIPSDLLSFEGEETVGAAEKTETVKGHVEKVKNMIEEAKRRKLQKAKMEAKRRELEKVKMEAKKRELKKVNNVALCNAKYEYEEDEGAEEYYVDKMCWSVGSSSLKQKSVARNINDTATMTMTTKEPVIPTINVDSSDFDVTMVPKQLDSEFEKFSHDEMYGGVVRATTLKTSDVWGRKYQPDLLSPLTADTLLSEMLRTKRNEAFDLLDALSRSGNLPIACAELHIIIASTHCFEKSVVDTVVKDNVNPIEKIERTHLLIASIIHGVPLKDLLRDKNDMQRITAIFSESKGGELSGLLDVEDPYGFCNEDQIQVETRHHYDDDGDY